MTSLETFIFISVSFFKEDELVIGLIARYHAVKGHDIFIKAVNLISKKVSKSNPFQKLAEIRFR